MITQLKVINATAEEEDVTLTNDERDEALQKAEDLLRSADSKDKEEYHLSLQGLSSIYEENALDLFFRIVPDCISIIQFVVPYLTAEAILILLFEQVAVSEGGKFLGFCKSEYGSRQSWDDNWTG